MKLRETLLGVLVLAAVLGGAWWARTQGGPKGSAAGEKPAAAEHGAPDTPLPDVTLSDASVDLGDVRLVLSVERPVLAFSKVRWRARAEANGAPVALEGGRISFEMTMPMGDHRYTLVPGADGWQEAEVVLPMCKSGRKTWYATVEGNVAGKARTARFQAHLTPRGDAPAPAVPAAR
jgi:hypothetical protein